MRRLKKLAVLLFLSTALLSMLVAGCGRKKGGVQNEGPAETNKGEIDGVLLQFTGSEIGIKNDEGEYLFDISQAVIDTRNMRSGDELLVAYEGDLKGTDTSGVKVTSVKDLGNNNEEREEKEAVGTLVDISMNTITIRQNDGTLLIFLSNNCKHEFKNGLREGNWIVVAYIGEIQGTNTQNVAVVKITDNDENIIENAQKDMKIKAVDETVYATAGVHIRASYSTEADIVGSLAKGKSIRRTGVCDNGWSRVMYDNKDAYIYGDYLTTEAPSQDSKPAKTDGSAPKTPQKGKKPAPLKKPDRRSGQQEPDNQPEQQEPDDQPGQQEPDSQPAVQEKTVDGTVVDVSMNTLTADVDGQVYTVNIMDAAHEYANGIQTGNTVTITYTGDLADEDVIIIKVQDKDPNTSAENSVYTGTVVDAAANTITIETDDGAVITFDKSSAEDNAGEIQIGVKVDVTADVTESEPHENIITAKQIDLSEE